MTGEISSSYEKDLNEIILEYINYCHYAKTSSSFVSELKEKGKTVSKNVNLQASENANPSDKFFEYLHDGNKLKFLDLWHSTLTEKLRQEDTVCQKLEFYCQIYFAIYPIRNNVQDKSLEAAAMQEFRDYLETKGAKLSKSTEFVRYYALPYVPNPREHPSFSELFQDGWVPGLEMRLHRFFELVLTQRTEPRLCKLYKRGSNVNDGNASLKQLQTKVVDSERRAQHVGQRLNQVQVDYHSLIGISAELVDLLEGSLQGVPVNAGHLQHVCQRLLTSQQHRLLYNRNTGASYDLSRPGTASRMLRQSMSQSLVPENLSTVTASPIGDIATTPGTSTTNGRRTSSALKKSARAEQSKPKAINFSKVKQDIENGEDKTRALLLQALRWRLTKSDTDTRDRLITGLSQHDVLGVQPGQYRDSVHSLLSGATGGEDVRQCLARLLNAVSTLSRGRSYLVTKTDICELLMTNIKNYTNQECILRENLIGTLQKLSLRRSIQSFMIQQGMMEWLMSLLEENDQLSDYTLDYAVALLMNLCLRSSGKKRCTEHKTRVLKVLSGLLNTLNTEITSYVNGALYSILVVPEIREEAKLQNMEQTLRSYIKTETPDMNRQIEYIINQLNSDDQPKFDESDDEEDEDDEEDPEVMEVELDKDERVLTSPGGSTLCGEALLAASYSIGEPGQSSVPTLSRPVTPGTFMAGKRSGLGQAGPAIDIERPPTRSGSQQQDRDKPQTGRYEAPPNPNDYSQVFAEKPKLPRTPYHPSSQASLPGPPRPSSGRPNSSHSMANSARQSRHSIANVTK